MRTKRLRTTVLTILTIAAFATPAAAAEAPIEGAGVVQAEGKGEVWAFGRGKVQYRMSGEGTLTVRNVLENSVTSDGAGTRTVDGTIVIYSEFEGTVAIEGPSISAHSEGGPVAFEGSGLGSVVLAGTGTYRENGGAPQAWQTSGSTVLMARPADPEKAEADTDAEDAEYEQQTVVVVREIQRYTYYNEWAGAYPTASVALGGTRHYYDWSLRFPIASAALHYHRGWSGWLSFHPFLSVFFGDHHDYVTWRRAYPVYGIHFRHPHSYHRWRKRHHTAHKAVSGRAPYSRWAARHPAAARGLTRRITARRDIVPVRERRGGQVSLNRSAPRKSDRIGQVRTSRPAASVRRLGRSDRIERVQTSRPAASVRRLSRSDRIERVQTSRPKSSVRIQKRGEARRAASDPVVRRPAQREVRRLERTPSRQGGSAPRQISEPRRSRKAVTDSVSNSVARSLGRAESRSEKKQFKFSERSLKLGEWNSRQVEKRAGNTKALSSLERTFSNRQAKIGRQAGKAQAKSRGSRSGRRGR